MPPLSLGVLEQAVVHPGMLAGVVTKQHGMHVSLTAAVPVPACFWECDGTQRSRLAVAQLAGSRV